MEDKTVIFSDFNINTLTVSHEKQNEETPLPAYVFDIRNFEPPRATPESRTCFDHVHQAMKPELRQYPRQIATKVL